MSNDQTKTAYGSPPLSILHLYSQYSDCIIIFLFVLRLCAGIDLRGQADHAPSIVSNLGRLVYRLLRRNIVHVCSQIVKVYSTKSIVIISSKDQDPRLYQMSGAWKLLLPSSVGSLLPWTWGLVHLHELVGRGLFVPNHAQHSGLR